jgi:retron-type reverse transcriptase
MRSCYAWHFGRCGKAAAPGVDGQSYEDYAVGLDENLWDLYKRLKSGRYRAPVIRRVYIPKANRKLRALGITTIEDRVVEKAVAWVLSAVFDQDFLDCSHGFRPNRSPHTALQRLRQGIMQHWPRYVVEVDIVNYFGSVNWTWLRKFVRHRVNDGGLIRLLNKWLKAGVMENGVVVLGKGGTARWPRQPRAFEYLPALRPRPVVRAAVQKTCRGYADLTCFADDYFMAEACRLIVVVERRYVG